MAFIKTRKKIVSTAIASSLSIIAGNVMAEEKAVQLETINQTVNKENYKVEKASSDKFTQSQLNTTQTMAIIPEKVLKEQNATYENEREALAGNSDLRESSILQLRREVAALTTNVDILSLENQKFFYYKTRKELFVSIYYSKNIIIIVYTIIYLIFS